MQSQSEYELGQEGSAQDFEPSEEHLQRLRPNSRHKYPTSLPIHLVEREGSRLAGKFFSKKLTAHQPTLDLQNWGSFPFQVSQIRNYQVVYKEPKPAVDKRQTRGIHNPLPSEITNIKQNRRLDVEVDEEGYLIGQNDEDQLPLGDQDESSIFNPEIGLILWRRERENTDEPEFLIKFKGKSYLHTEWLTQKELETLGKPVRNKINRFNKNFAKRLQEMNYDQDALQQGKYFDQSFLEVDRILTATEMFPIIHQKKANQIKGKWSQSLMLVCSKLLNFTKNHIHYGVLFCEPVNAQRDNCPEYTKLISKPMDLGSVLNKIYLDLYKSSKEFWEDIGLVWKNCLKFNTQENSDLRTLGLTQRECAIFLYDQWYHLCEKRYLHLKQEMAHLYIEKADCQPKPDQMNQINQNPVESIIRQNTPDKNHMDEEPKQNHSQEIKDQELKYNLKIQQELQPIVKNGNLQVSNFQINQELKEMVDVQPKEQLSQKQGGASNNQQLEGSMLSNEIQEQQRQIDMETPHPSRKEEEQEDQRQYLNMEHFYQKNIFLTNKKIQTPTTKEEIEILNPGQFTYSWLDDEGNGSRFLEHSYEYIDNQDMKKLDLNLEVNRFYMVKWKNLSYSQATWQQESIIGCPDKIAQFKQINKALGKDHRMLMQSQKDKHRILVDIQFNPKKRSRYSNQTINEFKNKLYSYDVLSKKQPHQYTGSNITVYKNYKLLRSYQLDSLNWLIKAWYEKRNTILADQMGLGKTIQSIAFLYHLYTIQNVKGPFLVIAPLSTLEHWKRTIEDWTTLNCVLYYDQNGQSGRRSIQYYQWYHTNITMKGNYLSSQLNKFQILLTSYEVFLLDFNSVIINVPFQFVVVDEAHRLKNKNAKILATLKKLPCRRVLLLTGTPIQNNTNQLWSLLNYIEPDKFAHSEEFKREFGDLSSNQQVDKLNRNLKPFMLRRMKEDVQQSIPPLQQTIIDVEMTNIQKTIYRALFEKNKHMLVKGLSAATSCNTNLNNLQIQLRKCCNHPFLIKQLEADLTRECVTQQDKIDKLISASGKMVLVKMLLQKYKKQGKKILIFSQFTHMLHLIEELLRWFDYKYERIDGQIKAKERQAAIDRYNNPDKNRDVFLLSTKAGGIGINLTSANVVIIYDSDWNPQNDVQATARAHRIGQKSEVKVYRLVTSNTYETEMFERATQKLGLDKAIFIGGTFKETGANPTAALQQNKLTKTEMETLLKRGILGFLENQGQEQYFDEDVDNILERKSRIANYSVVSGAVSVEKRKFKTVDSDNNLKLNDPNFWNIVLKNVASPSQQLLKKIKSLEDYTDTESQRTLMAEAAQIVNILIENKLSLSGFNADDEINLSEFLTTVNSERQFHKHYRELASAWLQEICKPSRRFKKLTPDDLIVGRKPFTKKVNTRVNEDENNIFVDSNNIQEEQSQSASEEKIKLNDQKRDELLKRICALCEKAKCVIHCSGFCKRAFHEECKKKIEDEGINILEGSNEKFQPKELCMDVDILKNIIEANTQCKDCQENLIACYICKGRGHYYGAQYQKSKKGSKKGGKQGEIIDQRQESTLIIKNNNKRKNDVTKCSTANCAKFYHPKCIEQYDTKKLFRYIDLNSLHFRCSLHYCNVCGVSGDTMSIFQCIRCPKALHIRCMDKDKVVKISKKLFICDTHFKTKKELKKATDRFTVSIPPIKKVNAKTQKIERKKKQRQQIVSPVPEEKSEDESQIRHGYKTRRNKNPQQAEPKQTLLPTYMAPAEERKPARSLRDKNITLLTYQELGIPPIHQYDYSKHDKDWCRYCGSRYSSNFTQGPWGSKTLCTVHYINWKQMRTLNLDAYPDKPDTPINPYDEQELKFLTNYSTKNNIPKEDLITYLESRKGKRPNHTAD